MRRAGTVALGAVPRQLAHRRANRRQAAPGPLGDLAAVAAPTTERLRHEVRFAQEPPVRPDRRQEHLLPILELVELLAQLFHVVAQRTVDRWPGFHALRQGDLLEEPLTSPRRRKRSSGEGAKREKERDG